MKGAPDDCRHSREHAVMSRRSNKAPFHFDISLSVLNHLGRRLYRSFMTVLGEAVSNAWDADATNVRTYLDIDENTMVIKDDGQGMSRDDFQEKFLKIGYSKRKEGSRSPERKRPFIGRKGIGKLALLSCAEKITVVSKVRGGQYIGGVIDNSGLDKAITDDLTPSEYPLQDWNRAALKPYMRDHSRGTIILFERINEGVRHTLGFLKKSIALYFRFALLDKSFNIYLNDEKITTSCLDDLAMKTEFLWEINDISDPYVAHLKRIFTAERNESRKLKVKGDIKGFIASVEKPRDLKITTTDERVGVDLFVNGRLRERDILKHMPTARVVESYLYGQVHCDLLDDKVDRFTSSRESVVADDPKFEKIIKLLKTRILNDILKDWDSWRRKHREDGDAENLSMTRKERKAEELFNVVAEEYAIKDDDKAAKPVDAWVTELGEDARFNFGSYAECFIAENLIRRFIAETRTPLSDEAKRAIEEYRRREKDSKERGNVSIELRKSNTNLSYLAMDDLANLVDKRDKTKEACLARDAAEYKPSRDAMAHTALLTDEAKTKLTTVYENIKGRLRTLFSASGTRKGAR